jgi:prefoldin subunit 5
MHAGISLVRQRINEMRACITLIRQRINEMHACITLIRQRINEMHACITLIRQRINEMHARISLIHEAINEKHACISLVRQRINEMHSRISFIREPINEIDERFIDIEQRSFVRIACLRLGGPGCSGAHAAMLVAFRTDSFKASAFVSVRNPGEHMGRVALAMVPVLSPSQRATFASHLRTRAQHES